MGPVRYWQSPDVRRTRTLWSDGSTVDEVNGFGSITSGIKTPKNIGSR